MNNSKFFLSLLTIFIVSGCASSGPSFPKLTHEEAASFEKSLSEKHAALTPRPDPEKLYVQPTNKREECKLPTSAEQLQRRNFKAYWDGECKNGHAFGLGRDIAISDTHHVEEITIYNGAGDSLNQPSIYYDFVNNYAVYGYRGENYNETIRFIENYNIENGELTVHHNAEFRTKQDDLLSVVNSPLFPKKIYRNASEGVFFEFEDWTASPAILPNEIAFRAAIKDYSHVRGGVAIEKYGNGVVRHLKLDASGQWLMVEIPKTYTDHLLAKLHEVTNAIPKINQALDYAKKIEREYLHLACNGKHKIEGLSRETATKACRWRDELQPLYAAALEKYKLLMEQRLQKVKDAEEKRRLQQQIAQQQQLIDQRKKQAFTESLNNFSSSIAAQNRQMMQPKSRYQPSWSQPQPSQSINCIRLNDRITNCR